VWIVKSDEKMVLYIDAQLASEARVSKRMKPINKLYLGGIPVGGTDFLENSVLTRFLIPIAQFLISLISIRGRFKNRIPSKDAYGSWS